MKTKTREWYKNTAKRLNKELDTDNDKIFNEFLTNHKRVISK